MLFVSCVREGPDLSGDSEKVFHRSLHLLHFWITDCKTVDFAPTSNLVDLLETFLNTEVVTFCPACFIFPELKSVRCLLAR